MWTVTVCALRRVVFAWLGLLAAALTVALMVASFVIARAHEALRLARALTKSVLRGRTGKSIMIS